jgi:hypothetical protein
VSVDLLMEKELWPMTQGWATTLGRKRGMNCDQMKTCCIE